MNTAVERDAPVPDGRGMVVLHVASAFEGHNWDHVEVWSETEKRVYDLHRELVRDTATPEYPDTALMIGALPTGTYRLNALKDTETTGNTRTTYTAPVGERLGRFKVEAARVTDLGTVLYYPENWYFSMGDFQLIRLPANADTRRSLQYKNPVAYAAAGKQPALGWLDGRGVFPAATLALVKASLPRLFSITEMRNGDLYIGGMLGQIHKRPARGAWTTLDTGIHEEVFRVVEGSDGIYAACERLLLKSTERPPALNWSRCPPPGHVAYAGHVHYRIDDQFPERRSRNLPVITQLTVTDDRAADIPAALERWPLLKGYTISPAIAAKALPAFRY